MIRGLALVEGPTERNFGQQVLAPHLGHHGVSFSPKVIGKPGHKGGCRWEVAKREILALIKQGPQICTTMFDLYGLPDDWPSRARCKMQEGLQKNRCCSRNRTSHRTRHCFCHELPIDSLPVFRVPLLARIRSTPIQRSRATRLCNSRHRRLQIVSPGRRG